MNRFQETKNETETFTKELLRSAVVAYISKGAAGEKYANEIEVFLNKFGTSYVQ